MYSYLQSAGASRDSCVGAAISSAFLSSTPLTSFVPDGPTIVPPSPKFIKDPVNGWIIGQHPDGTVAGRELLQSKLIGRHEAFAYNMRDLKGYSGPMGPMRITLKPGVDVSNLYSPKRRYSPLESDIINEHGNELRDAKITVESRSPIGVASAPVPFTHPACCPTLPMKKDLEGNPTKHRMCTDIRNLNKNSEDDKYGLHLPEELFRRVGDATFFSKIDLRGAFLQLPIHEDDQYLTTWWWGNELWKYTRCPYGLKQAPAHMQRVMDSEIDRAGLANFCVCFIDDLLVYSNSEQEHIEHIALVLDMLLAVDLRAHPDKCILCCEAVEYLGFLLGTSFLHPHTSKIQAIQALKPPTTLRGLQAVLGFCNYYRCFLPDYSVLAHDLNALTRANTPWVWTEVHQAAFDRLKELLCEEGRVLRLYKRDAPTFLYTDWCNHGMGAVLAQVDADTGREHIVSCISRSLNKHEANYGSYHGELSAAVWAIRYFRHYLHGIEFTLVTDHQPLKWLLTTTDLVGKPARWMLMVMEFSFTVVHRPGKDHINADVLSRMPIPSTFDHTGSRLDPHPDDHQTAVEYLQQNLSNTYLADPRKKQPQGGAPDTSSRSNIAPPRPRSPSAAAASTSDPAALTSLLASAAPGPLPTNPATFMAQAPNRFPVLPVSQEEALLLPPVASFMDNYAPARHVAPSDNYLPDGWWDPNSINDDTTALTGAQQLVRDATNAVCHAVSNIIAAGLPPSQQQRLGANLPNNSCRETIAISNQPVGPSFYSAASSDGLVLIELFGGICSGLEMVLSAGFSVSFYIYSDTSKQARIAAWHRVQSLSLQYSDQFPRSAWDGLFQHLPMDVKDITAAHLEILTRANPNSRFMLIAGWPCEDLSAAGKGQGLAGSRSSAFFDTIRILGCLQQLLPHPPAYLLENTYMLWGHTADQVKYVDFPHINSVLGTGFTADAARFGSGAYRLRMFWTNLQAAQHLHLALSKWKRPSGLLVDSLLDRGRAPLQLNRRCQPPPHYQCNLDPTKVEVLPTLVSYPKSNNFRGGRAGVLHDTNLGIDTEPNADERERLLGYATGTTAAPGLTEADRFRLTGQCMDANQLRAIFFTCLALDDILPTLLREPAQAYASVSSHKPATFLPPQLPPIPPGDWDTYPIEQADWGDPCPSKGFVGMRLLRSYGWSPGQTVGNPRRQGLLWPLEVPTASGSHGLGYTPPAATVCRPTSPAHLPPQLDLQAVAGGGTLGLHPSSLLANALFSITSPCHYDLLCSYHAIAQAEEQSLHLADPPNSNPPRSSNPDIWLDSNCQHYLTLGQYPEDIPLKERQRIWKRVKNYRYLPDECSLQRLMPDKAWKTVPPLPQRTELILRHHRQTGHWGIRRTHYMLALQYWWYNMRGDVVAVLATCIECSRIKASFSASPPQLQPLAIEGLFYRWSVDLCGPFPITRRGNRYVMVMIDSFSKYLEVEAIPDKAAATTAYTFVRQVLCRYGACAEVVTDQGAEWMDEFHQCLQSAFIDHRTTSANHPSANGQAERTVQSIKRALDKYSVPVDGHSTSWDEYLPHVALGYRVSVQESLGFSPYELLYGTKAILPAAIRGHFSQPLSLADPEQAAVYLDQRAELLAQHCAIAANNLRIAQHRDALRYQKMRSGCYNTIPVKFSVGDLVYVRRPSSAVNLQSAVRTGIYRIYEVRDSGVLVIHGKCGTRAEVHSTNCAPCHLANVNPTIDSSLREVHASHACHICSMQDREDTMLICDGCQRGYHLSCLDPPLDSVPEEEIWCCPECLQQGITPVIR